jgi:hypothetical protein
VRGPLALDLVARVVCPTVVGRVPRERFAKAAQWRRPFPDSNAARPGCAVLTLELYRATQLSRMGRPARRRLGGRLMRLRFAAGVVRGVRRGCVGVGWRCGTRCPTRGR